MEISGKFLDNEPNLDGRFYNKESVSKAISKYSNSVKDKTSFGELDADNGNLTSLSKTGFDITHIVEDINETENGVYGTIRILDTPKGKLVKEMIKSGVNYGISARYFRNGDELNILSFDLVSDLNNQTSILSIEPQIEDDDSQFEDDYEDEV